VEAKQFVLSFVVVVVPKTAFILSELEGEKKGKPFSFSSVSKKTFFFYKHEIFQDWGLSHRESVFYYKLSSKFVLLGGYKGSYDGEGSI